MESLLIIVTVASLLLAIAMSIVAWSLIRAERQRAAARIEALEALAFEPSADDLHGRPRSGELPLWDAALGSPAPTGGAQPHHPTDYTPSQPLFETAATATGTGGRWLALAAVGLLVAAVYATAAALKSPEILGAVAATAAESDRHRGPLELLSLRHSLELDGSFSVRGLVQNPDNGRVYSGLEAVVYLFDESDQYFQTGKAPLDTSAVGPGGESAFEVRIPNAAGVSRYRVGFRQADGTTVAHLDRRGRVPERTTGDTVSDAGIVQHGGGISRAEGQP